MHLQATLLNERRPSWAKYHRRKDGLLETTRTDKNTGKRFLFYGRTERDIDQQIMGYANKVECGPTFGAVAEEWWSEYLETVAEKTISCYKAPYLRALHHFETTYIKDITPQMVSLFMAMIACKKYSLRTVKAHLSVLNMIFNHAILRGDILYSPSITIRPPKGLKKTTRNPPEDQEIQKVIDVGVDLPFGLFAYMLLYTGCRRGEVLALKYEDIDFTAKIIHITKAISYPSNKPII